MKILYLTHDAFGQGGVARMLSVKTSLLTQKYGHEIDVISSGAFSAPFYSFDSSISIKYLHAPTSLRLSSLLYFRKLKRAIKNIKPDCIVICDNGLKGYLTCFIRLNIPLIFESHAIDFIPFLNTKNKGLVLKRFFLKKLHALALNRVDKIVTLSKSQSFFLHLDNAVVIPNPSWSANKKKAELTSKKVIAMGRLVESKGYVRMIEIWKEIHKIYPDWHLDIYGDGEQKDLLHNQINAYNLDGSISVKKSAVEIEDFLMDYAFMIHTSFYESFPLVVMESMSFGLPVVAFDCPVGLKEIIRTEEDGFLIENDDLDAFAEKTKSLIANISLRQKMGENAFKNIQRYDLDDIIEVWNTLFVSLQRNYRAVK
jgi:glycosyltransferase involved in cell wall biosynthesis